MDSVYDIGPNTKEKRNIFSIKANSTLLNAINESDSQEVPYFQFLSEGTAQVVIGSEVFELKLCEVNPTVCFFIG
jgi:hypothetical protein